LIACSVASDLVVPEAKFCNEGTRMENEKIAGKSGRVTLKTVADHLGLTAGTISAVLNNTQPQTAFLKPLVTALLQRHVNLTINPIRWRALCGPERLTPKRPWLGTAHRGQW
jgi:hypothetical protein